MKISRAIIAGAALLLVTMGGMYLRAASRVNKVALAATAKPVSVVKAQAGSYHALRSYVGTLQPWALAKVGPQYVSAYLGTVLVRPGDAVRRGQVLGTLDCRNASASSQEIAARARALEERRNAIAHEADRVKQMSEGGFASANELEQLQAKTSSESAEVEGLRASLSAKTLQVDDCVLRAPFAGEVADRLVDPGAYVRPGQAVVTVVDRNMVRVTADAPESDFDVVEPGTAVKIIALSVDARLTAKISRRAPAADEVTRTVHFEIDVPNSDHHLPAGTTATLAIQIGQPAPATLVPLRAATVRGDKATLFTVEHDQAKRLVLRALGEAEGMLYLEPKLAADARIVVEGRSLLEDGDPVAAKELAE